MSHKALTTIVPALNTLGNLAALYAQVGKNSALEELYLPALHGAETVFGHGSGQCRRIAAALDALRSKN